MYITSASPCQLDRRIYNLWMTHRFSTRRSPFRKIYAIPSEHGSWIWWIGPLTLGTAAAGRFTSDLILLSITFLAAFLIRQPVVLVVKVRSGRRPTADLAPAAFWIMAYGLVLAATTTALIHQGHARLLLLLLPGLLVFSWHLWLVARREERGQRGIEIVGSGVLALAAPAGYWVGSGSAVSLPWILGALAWLQSAASIVLVYLRLEQRHWPSRPLVTDRLRQGSRALGYHIVNLVFALILCYLGLIPWLVAGAFGLMLSDALDGVLRPAIRQPPVRIGLRQLAASTSFFALGAVAFLL